MSGPVRAAASIYENANPCSAEDEHFAERTHELLTQYRDDVAKVQEADDWICGTQDGDHYAEVESALADLHGWHPEDLIGSALLVRLYRLASHHGLAREAKLRCMAGTAAIDEWDAMHPDTDDFSEITP